MSCNCNLTTIRSKSLEITGEEPNRQLQININSRAFNELDRVGLVICQTIPNEAILGSYPVVITPEGGEKIPVHNRVANLLRADQIRTRKRYTLYHGTDPIHFYVRDHVPQTNILV